MFRLVWSTSSAMLETTFYRDLGYVFGAALLGDRDFGEWPIAKSPTEDGRAGRLGEPNPVSRFFRGANPAQTPSHPLF